MSQDYQFFKADHVYGRIISEENNIFLPKVA